MIAWGKCHVCTSNTSVRLCEKCGHWMCPTCEWKVGLRFKAAMEEIMSGAKEGCCGPGGL